MTSEYAGKTELVISVITLQRQPSRSVEQNGTSKMVIFIDGIK